MNATDAADVAPLLIILVPLLIAMIASMKPERKGSPTRSRPDEQAAPHSAIEEAGDQDTQVDQ